MTQKQRVQQEAVAYLKTLIKPSSTITIVQKSVSRSGMCRRLRLYTKEGRDITEQAGQALEWSVNDVGLRVDGCGMDMHFWTIECLSRVLFGRKPYKSFKGNGGSCLAWESL